jgi:hypothetical protein
MEEIREMFLISSWCQTGKKKRLAFTAPKRRGVELEATCKQLQVKTARTGHANASADRKIQSAQVKFPGRGGMQSNHICQTI